MASGSPNISVPLNPVRASLWFQRQPIRFSSPWSGESQVFRRFGLWKIRYEWEDLNPDEYDELYTLFDYYGSDQPFTIYNIKRPLPRGDATPAALASLKVFGGGQTGRTLNVDGGPAGTKIFARGDFVGLALTGQCFRVKADCTTNGSGQATVNLCQYIRASPADNEDVVVSYVPIRVLLDRDPEDPTRSPELASFTVEMTEFLT